MSVENTFRFSEQLNGTDASRFGQYRAGRELRGPEIERADPALIDRINDLDQELSRLLHEEQFVEPELIDSYELRSGGYRLK